MERRTPFALLVVVVGNANMAEGDDGEGREKRRRDDDGDCSRRLHVLVGSDKTTT